LKNAGASPTGVRGTNFVVSARDQMFYRVQMIAALVDALMMVVDHHLDI